jgi:hypothetical protein
MISKQNFKYVKYHSQRSGDNKRCCINVTKSERGYTLVNVNDPVDPTKANLELKNFYIVKNFDDTISLKTSRRKKYLIVENGSISFIARAEGAKFYPINNSDFTVSFKLSKIQESKYISVTGKSYEIKAVENNDSANERFFLNSGIFLNDI